MWGLIVHCKDFDFCSVIGRPWSVLGCEVTWSNFLVFWKITLTAVLRMARRGKHGPKWAHQSGQYYSNSRARWWWLGPDCQQWRWEVVRNGDSGEQRLRLCWLSLQGRRTTILFKPFMFLFSQLLIWRGGESNKAAFVLSTPLMSGQGPLGEILGDNPASLPRGWGPIQEDNTDHGE